MTPDSISPRSVADRLARLAKEKRQDHSFVLVRYGIERLLWRISRSSCTNEFVLKGATLFIAWTGDFLRPTRDLDLLGRGAADLERLAGIFRELSGMDTLSIDGLVFHPESVVAERIRAQEEYEGVRIRMRATLERTRLDLHVDVGFGDAVTPPPSRMEFPTLLGFPAPVVHAYPPETVVAEKVQAMVELGVRNTRMKDYHDVLVLLRSGRLSAALGDAIRATFDRRRTSIPTEIPFGLSDEFGSDPGKERQWKAFLARKGSDEGRKPFLDVVREIRERIEPIFQQLREMEPGQKTP
jgi:hypothetical protein